MIRKLLATLAVTALALLPAVALTAQPAGATIHFGPAEYSVECWSWYGCNIFVWPQAGYSYSVAFTHYDYVVDGQQFDAIYFPEYDVWADPGDFIVNHGNRSICLLLDAAVDTWYCTSSIP